MKRERTQQKKKKQSKINAVATTSVSTQAQTQTQKKKQQQQAPAPSAPSARPKPTASKPLPQQATNDKGKEKEKEPIVSNAKGKQRAQNVLELDDSSSSDDAEMAPVQPSFSKPTQRSNPSTTKQARKTTSTAPSASISTSNPKSKPISTNPPNLDPSRPRPSITIDSLGPRAPPPAPPLASSRSTRPEPITDSRPSPSPPRNYPPEPTSSHSTPRTVAQQAAKLVQAAAVPLPEEDREEDYDEPSTQEDDEMDTEQGEVVEEQDVQEREDMRCVAEELARGEWLEEKKAKAWKDLAVLVRFTSFFPPSSFTDVTRLLMVEGEIGVCLQYPRRSAQEWESFYGSTDQIRGRIIEMVGERFEEIQNGHMKERDVESGWTKEDDELIVEELGRIERFREENVVAWESLARFVCFSFLPVFVIGVVGRS